MQRHTHTFESQCPSVKDFFSVPEATIKAVAPKAMPPASLRICESFAAIAGMQSRSLKNLSGQTPLSRVVAAANTLKLGARDTDHRTRHGWFRNVGPQVALDQGKCNITAPGVPRSDFQIKAYTPPTRHHEDDQTANGRGKA